MFFRYLIIKKRYNNLTADEVSAIKVIGSLVAGDDGIMIATGNHEGFQQLIDSLFNICYLTNTIINKKKLNVMYHAEILSKVIHPNFSYLPITKFCSIETSMQPTFLGTVNNMRSTCIAAL